jgi:hypothetical protein
VQRKLMRQWANPCVPPKRCCLWFANYDMFASELARNARLANV